MSKKSVSCLFAGISNAGDTARCKKIKQANSSANFL